MEKCFIAIYCYIAIIAIMKGCKKKIFGKYCSGEMSCILLTWISISLILQRKYFPSVPLDCFFISTKFHYFGHGSMISFSFRPHMELLHKLHVWNSCICQGPLPRVLLFCEYQSHIKGGKGKVKENFVLQSGCRDVAVKLKAQPQPLKDGYYFFFFV